MKKILIVTTAVLGLALMTAAQNTRGTTIGLRGGVNFQNLNGKNAAGNDLNNSIKTGWHAGLNLEVPVGTSSYLQPGILYSTKGSGLTDGNDVRLSYVEVPVNFVYKPMLGTGNMILGFGPYAALAVGGKVENPAGVETDIDFDGPYNSENLASQFKKFDAGGNLLVGYEFARRLSFQLNAQLGLVDINKENPAVPDDPTRWRNTGFGLSLGYRF